MRTYVCQQQRLSHGDARVCTCVLVVRTLALRHMDMHVSSGHVDHLTDVRVCAHSLAVWTVTVRLKGVHVSPGSTDPQNEI